MVLGIHMFRHRFNGHGWSMQVRAHLSLRHLSKRISPECCVPSPPSHPSAPRPGQGSLHGASSHSDGRRQNAFLGAKHSSSKTTPPSPQMCPSLTHHSLPASYWESPTAPTPLFR